MSPDDGHSAEMRRLLKGFRVDPLALDDDSADRLLAGRLDPADAPPGYAEAAAVMAAATAPPTLDELDGVERSLDAFRAALLAPPSPPRRPHMLVKLLTVKAAAAVFAGALVVGGVAAAATGVLPEVAQRVVGAAPAPAGEDQAQDRAAAAKGPDLTGTARAGLCRAYMAGQGAANGGKANSAAFQALARAAGGADKVGGYCKDVTAAAGSQGQAAAGAGQGQSASHSQASGPDLSTLDKVGLCRAYLKLSGTSAQSDAASFESLVQAAGGADKVTAFCESVLSTAQPGSGAGDRVPDTPPAGSGHGGGQG